ncbi:prolyl oligopeptidase family serine peptidase [Roseimicrobium sp. ORNL1]|uniref:carboxylesterase family protein n=1 Tax=Roseimicrobium sp. ORNL1 TaxID=2711231 RepID=UPI0013E1FCA9|nr:prolyl oligopeptidase family serine peptidase [Roseimicrobium sp. ORNL1]QIF04452.1 prolyl oligopeptidase family serine peptidase [Roseimicrobium sp. ORNL1]
MKRLIALLTAMGLPMLASARTWTAADGRKLEADLVSATAAAVTVKNAAGQTFTIPLERLSEEDRKWVQSNGATPPAAKPGAPASPTANAPHKPIEGTYASLVTGDWALSKHEDLPFALYASKELSASQKYPLVLALHGKSQNDENGKQVNGWMKSFTKTENYAAHPCIILAPLCYQPFGGTGAGWYDKPGTEAVDLVKKLIKSLPIDEKRIYVIGHSMGGFGTCHLMNAEPRLFTAGVAVSGCSGPETANTFKKRPLWIFHAVDDEVVKVSVSQTLAKALERSEKTFKYTEFPTGGHGIATKVFDDPEVHKWLFGQVEK